MSKKRIAFISPLFLLIIIFKRLGVVQFKFNYCFKDFFIYIIYLFFFVIYLFIIPFYDSLIICWICGWIQTGCCVIIVKAFIETAYRARTGSRYFCLYMYKKQKKKTENMGKTNRKRTIERTNENSCSKHTLLVFHFKTQNKIKRNRIK